MKQAIIKTMVMMTVFSLLLVGCSKASKGGKLDNVNDAVLKTDDYRSMEKEFNIACMETTQALVNEAISYMKGKGYNAKYTMFDNNRNTLAALNDGSVDAILAVHKPFMESFNDAIGADLMMAEPYVYTVGMGLFSDKYDSIDKIPEGATITIANDVMNMDRGLRILESVALIKLNFDVEQASVMDIQDNPRKLNIVDMDQTQLVRTLESADGTVAFFSHMRNADRDFTRYLARDTDLYKYPIGVVIRPANKNEAWVGDFIEALRSDKVKTFAQEYYGGLYEYYE
jgi:D-methionine transport system substrate-binding protein